MGHRFGNPGSVAACGLALAACGLALAAFWPPGASAAEAPAADEGEAKAPAPAPPVAVASDEIATYLEIPIVGTLGVDVVPLGMETCLRYVSQNPRIKHVVLRIRSPGGELTAAERILEIMQKYDRSVKYHALVEQANGVAILLAFACDTIHMTPAGTLGGAPSTPVDSAGGARLDAGAAASLAAKYAAAAAAKGYPEAIIRAMIMPDAPTCAWTDADGKVQIGPSVPPEVPDDKAIFRNGAGTLLVLNKDQAVKARVALWGVDRVADLGDFLGFAGWRSAGDYGVRVMQATRLNREHDVQRAKEDAARLKDAMEKNTQDRDAAIKSLRENVVEAQARETAAAAAMAAMQGSDKGSFSSFIKRTWRLETKAAIDAWINVQGYARLVAQLEIQARAWNKSLEARLEEWRGGKAPVPALVALADEAEKWKLKPLETDLNLLDLMGRAERAVERLKKENP
jgi:hypothetical protein